ncbi:MAG TPA: response regulator [Candidatus Melainabacteria bacterium]|jgi:two-component system, OmpR family, response regulator|nr:response regulator [Candidatus Melainabacteria bacterium]HIN64151.1 response regulator [Candidatus Obscuribacterales bacterium]
MRLLLVEDDSFLSEGVALALRHSGYVVDQVQSGTDADQALTATPYDLVILDLGLPHMDGIEVLKRLRSRGQATPVLILTARDTVTDRVTGLDSGANDYISKPFELLELEARIRALLRKEQWGNMTKIVVGGLEFDTVERRATINGDNLDLSARELAVLEQLLKSVGKVVNKVQLIRNLSSWDAELSHNALEIIMHRLRKKLEKTGINVRTVRGLGYMLEKPA